MNPSNLYTLSGVMAAVGFALGYGGVYLAASTSSDVDRSPRTPWGNNSARAVRTAKWAGALGMWLVACVLFAQAGHLRTVADVKVEAEVRM